jgi:hypothetical protein
VDLRLVMAEDRGFEPRMVLPPNGMSSSDPARPDRFNLDQQGSAVSLERRCTALDCNENCN